MSKSNKFGNSSSSISFVHFVCERNNRFLLLFVLIACVVQFSIFKYYYPFPDFSTDSYNYIFAAYAGLNINTWPIGYSKFLRMFHFLTHSDTTLVAFQFFFMELSALYFFFSFIYFYRPAKAVKIFLVIFLFFNPLLIYISNYIGSDTIFVSLSLLWFAEIFWLINKPNMFHVFAHVALLVLCFVTRNNAYYYPLISALVLILMRQKTWLKVTSVATMSLMIFSFIVYTRSEAFKLTGTKQFSLFTGWQMANNALYIYDKIEVDSNKLPNAECRELERINVHFFKHSTSWAKYKGELTTHDGNFFIQFVSSPLKRYQNAHYAPSDQLSQIISWAKVSQVYEQYGSAVIRQHPVAFAKYFLLLNTKNYFLPQLEKFANYNKGESEIEPVMQDWFDYPTPDVGAASPEIQGKILFIFSPFFLLMNLYFLGSLGWFVFKKKYLKTDPAFNKMILVSGCFLVFNFCFSVFVTIDVLRYQIFPMILCTTTSLLILDIINRIQSKEISIGIEKNMTEKLATGTFKFLQ